MKTYSEFEKNGYMPAEVEQQPTTPKRRKNTPQTAQILRLQQTVGNRAVQRMARSGKLQTKSSHTLLDDSTAEQEAEHIAGHLTHPSALMPTPPQSVQRQSTADPTTTDIPASVDQTLSHSGQPLDNQTRGFMESRFGHDFSGVRIHTDGQAAQSAADINARAYTAGNRVVFGSGEYRPETDSGKHLLAHELAHVVQQGQTSQAPAPVQRQKIDDQPTAAPAPIKRQDYVFIMGADPAKTKNPFYRSAIKYFGSQLPDATMITTVRSLDGLLQYIATHIKNPIGNLYIVSHGNEDGTLSFAFNEDDQTRKGRKASKDSHDDGLTTPGELRQMLHPSGQNKNTLTQLGNQIDDQTTIRIKGCNIGQNEEMINLIDEAFGGQGTVTAPTHEQNFGYSEVKAKGKKPVVKATNSLSGPIMQRPGEQLFTPDEVTDIVNTHYGHLPQKSRDELVKNFLKGQKVQTKTPYTFKTQKAPTTTKQAWSEFKDNFRGSQFKPNLRKPVNITSHEENGKLTFTYEFKGTTGKQKEIQTATATSTYTDIPSDADAERQAKLKFPNPENYTWQVDRKIENGSLKIRVVAKRVFVRLEHKSLDNKTPFNPDESDDYFYTTSTNEPPQEVLEPELEPE